MGERICETLADFESELAFLYQLAKAGNKKAQPRIIKVGALYRRSFE